MYTGWLTKSFEIWMSDTRGGDWPSPLAWGQRGSRREKEGTPRPLRTYSPCLPRLPYLTPRHLELGHNFLSSPSGRHPTASDLEVPEGRLGVCSSLHRLRARHKRVSHSGPIREVLHPHWVPAHPSAMKGALVSITHRPSLS